MMTRKVVLSVKGVLFDITVPDDIKTNDLLGLLEVIHNYYKDKIT